MKYTDLTPFHYRIFSVQELARYYHEPLQPIKMQLSRWCRAQKLIRLKRNCYTFPTLHPDSYHVAQALVSPSYTSLELVLSLHGIVPETVFVHSSVTSQKTQHYETVFGSFDYRHLSPDLFFGMENRDDGVMIACPEKALLDYLYLNSRKFKSDFSCWKEERFDELDTLDWEKMRQWAPKYGMKKLVRLVESLHDYSLSEEYQVHR